MSKWEVDDEAIKNSVKKEPMQAYLWSKGQCVLSTASDMVTPDMFDTCDYIVLDGSRYTDTDSYDEAHCVLEIQHQWKSKEDRVGIKKKWNHAGGGIVDNVKKNKWDYDTPKEIKMKQAYGGEDEDFPVYGVVGKYPTKQDHINPSHYKDFINGMQWWETQQWRSKDFGASSLTQVDKYLARLGGKDEELQELLKAKWYLDFLIARISAGRNIKVDEVKSILEKL